MAADIGLTPSRVSTLISGYGLGISGWFSACFFVSHALFNVRCFGGTSEFFVSCSFFASGAWRCCYFFLGAQALFHKSFALVAFFAFSVFVASAHFGLLRSFGIAVGSVSQWRQAHGKRKCNGH